MTIQAGDKVIIEATVNFTDGETAEVQIGETKYYMPVSLLGKVLYARPTPPDLGVSVSDQTSTTESLR